MGPRNKTIVARVDRLFVEHGNHAARNHGDRHSDVLSCQCETARDYRATMADHRYHPAAAAADVRAEYRKMRCEMGWTGDRCTKRLGHRGFHSNE